MKEIGTLSNGNLAIEVTPAEWLFLILHESKISRDLPAVCREYRKDNGISRTALARKAGITRNYLARIERGEVNVSLDIYRRLMTIAYKNQEVPLGG